MNSKIMKNYIYNLLNIFTTLLFPVIFFPYISRMLRPEYYGKYNFALSITSYFLILADFGTQSYGIKELIKAKIDSEKEFKVKLTELIIIGFFMSIISFIFYLFLILKNGLFVKDKVLFLIVGLPIVFSFLTLDYFFIATENYKRRTIRLLLIKSTSLIFMFFLVKQPKDYIIFASIIAVPELFARGVDLYTIKNFLSFKSLNLKKYIKPLTIIFFYTFSTNIYLNIDSTMLGFLRSNIEVGYYNVAIKMVKIAIPVTTSLGIVLSNKIIEKIKESDIAAIHNLINLYTDFIFFVSIPILTLLSLIRKEIIIIFSGKEYLNSSFSMIIMLPIIFFISMSRFYASQLLLPLNKEKYIFKVSIIGLCSNFFLNLLLIPKYGMVGAAFATLISEFLVFSFRFLEIKKIFNKYKLLTQKRMNYIFASSFSLILCFIFKKLEIIKNVYIEFIALTIIFGFIYLIFLMIKKEYFIVLGIKKLSIRSKKNEKSNNIRNF